eukprot:328144_1
MSLWISSADARRFSHNMSMGNWRRARNSIYTRAKRVTLWIHTVIFLQCTISVYAVVNINLTTLMGVYLAMALITIASFYSVQECYVHNEPFVDYSYAMTLVIAIHHLFHLYHTVSIHHSSALLYIYVFSMIWLQIASDSDGNTLIQLKNVILSEFVMFHFTIIVLCECFTNAVSFSLYLMMYLCTAWPWSKSLFIYYYYKTIVYEREKSEWNEMTFGFEHNLIKQAKNEKDKYFMLYILLHERSHRQCPQSSSSQRPNQLTYTQPSYTLLDERNRSQSLRPVNVPNTQANVSSHKSTYIQYISQPSYEAFESTPTHSRYSSVCWTYHYGHLQKSFLEQKDSIDSLIKAKTLTEFINCKWQIRCPYTMMAIHVNQRVSFGILCVLPLAILHGLTGSYLYCSVIWSYYVLYIAAIYQLWQTFTCFVEEEKIYWKYSHIFTTNTFERRTSIHDMLEKQIVQKGYAVLSNTIFPMDVSIIIVLYAYGEIQNDKYELAGFFTRRFTPKTVLLS